MSDLDPDEIAEIEDVIEDVIDDSDDDDGEVFAPESAPADDDDGESLQLEVYHGLVHCIVSNTALWSTVDVAEVKAVMDDAIAALPHVPLCLEPLWRSMLGKGAPRDAAMETVLLFHSRAPRWGIEMVLPPELAALDPAERAQRIEALRDRGGTSGTQIAKMPAPPPAARRTRSSSSRGAASSSSSSPSPRAAPASSTRAAPIAAAPSLRARTIAWAVRVAFVAAIVVLVAVKSGDHDVTPGLTRALGPLCTDVSVHGRAALCTATQEALENKPRARERAEIAGLILDVQVVFVNHLGEVLAL